MTSLESWIVGQGLSGSSVASLLSGFAEQLLAEGIPVVRAYLALPTVNPTIRVHNRTWTRSTGTVIEDVSHERIDRFEASPFGHMVRTGVVNHHWRFDKPGPEWFGVFDEVKREGGQDYLARLIRFEETSALDLRGIAASFSTDREASSPLRSLGSMSFCPCWDWRPTASPCWISRSPCSTPMWASPPGTGS
jgi:adenylate cyclase